MHIPTEEELRAGTKAFRDHEKRDAMYRVSRLWVEQFWRDFGKMADGVGVFLLMWNQAFYRYGPFDFDALQACIERRWPSLEARRNRDLLTLSPSEAEEVIEVFGDFLQALVIAEGPKKGQSSPVAVAKALHMLAPTFFPLWDNKIAIAYGCRYSKEPARQYLSFMEKTKELLVACRNWLPAVAGDRSSLKVVDEFNYARYTRKWV